MHYSDMEEEQKKLQFSKLQKKYSTSRKELIILDIQRIGIKSEFDDSVVKLQIKFTNDENIYHKPIINNPRSIYSIKNNKVYVYNEETDFGIKELIEDSPRHYYFRGKKTLVINSTFLETCQQGCEFCEQTTAPINKRRYSLKLSPKEIFTLIEKENDLKNLEELKQISIVTSCAGTEERAIYLLQQYVDEARNRGFVGKVLFATNEVRSEEGLKKLVKIGNVILAFTVECFSNRRKFMPGRKGDIELSEIKKIFKIGKQLGLETTYFYIFGLDNHEDMELGFRYLKDSITIAPTGPNYQPQGKEKALVYPSLEYFLKARKIYARVHEGLERFESNQNFRSLWPLEKKSKRVKVYV
jgi:hypothetical protein